MDKTLGSRVKQLRKEKGFTQAELGVLAGVHHTNIGRIENKEVIPQADILYLIAKNLDTNVEWLLTGKNIDSKNTNKCYGNVNDELIQKIITLCEKLSLNEKNQIIQFIQFILYCRTSESKESC